MMRCARCAAAAMVLVGALGGCKSSSAHEAVDAAMEAGAALVLRDAAAAVAADAAPADDLVPQSSAEELATRGRHLLEAVAHDDTDLAVDILFPRDGWLAVRDAADPGKDWDHTVQTPFRKALHALSKHHRNQAHAQFVSLELGHDMVQATPKKHGWKKPLWTVHGARLTFTSDGHTRTVLIHEMTAWRGAWYVTRLR